MSQEGLLSGAGGGGLGFISLTPYIVGQPGDAHAGFTTISSAITQAVADGASTATPKNIYVKPGTYTENLTLADGINIIGFEPVTFSYWDPVQRYMSVILNGNVTISGAGSITKVANLNINAPLGQVGIFVNDGTTLTLQNVLLIGSTADAIRVSSTAFFNNLNIIESFIIPVNTFNAVSDNGSKTISIINASDSEIAGPYSFTNATSIVTLNENNVNHASGGINITANILTFTFTGINSGVYANFTIGAATGGAGTFTGCSFLNGLTLFTTNTSWQLRTDLCTGFNNGFPTTSNVVTSSGEGNLGFNNFCFTIRAFNALTGGFAPSNFYFVQNGLQTSSGAAQTLYTLALTAGASYIVKGYVNGANVAHTDITGGDFLVLIDRSAGIVGVPVKNVFATSTGTFSVSASGTNLLVQVTAPSAATYNWVCTLEFQPMVSNA